MNWLQLWCVFRINAIIIAPPVVIKGHPTKQGHFDEDQGSLHIVDSTSVTIMLWMLSGPLNRLNAILSLLHPLDRYRTPSAIGSAIGRHLSRPISHPNTGGSRQPPRSKPVGNLNRMGHFPARAPGHSCKWRPGSQTMCPNGITDRRMILSKWFGIS